MADPKYANLPGIAFDQPDVFETTGAALPEVGIDLRCFVLKKTLKTKFRRHLKETYGSKKGSSFKAPFVSSCS